MAAPHAALGRRCVAVVVLGGGVRTGVLGGVAIRVGGGACTTVLGCDAVLSERETYLGVGIAGFVLAGLGVAGLVTTWVLDANQPRARVRVAFGPMNVSLAGTF